MGKGPYSYPTTLRFLIPVITADTVQTAVTKARVIMLCSLTRKNALHSGYSTGLVNQGCKFMCPVIQLRLEKKKKDVCPHNYDLSWCIKGGEKWSGFLIACPPSYLFMGCTNMPLSCFIAM